MDSNTQNVPATVREQAKQRALKILESEPNCISYVKPEDLETSALFIPVVSIIKPAAEDFHPVIPNIGILPKVPLQNLIREKSGTNILHTDTSKRGEYIWVAHSFGERRMPDGTMQPDDGSYEYDVQKRAELDFLKDSEKKTEERKYTSENAKRKYILELCKSAESKAVTGAQWIVIKKLAKIAASFKTPQELMRGMKIIRYDRNIDGILGDPGMRDAVIQHALGATESVFGPKQIEGQPVPRTVNVETQEVIENGDLFPEAEKQPEPSVTDKLKAALAGYKELISAAVKPKNEPSVHEQIDALIAEKDATEAKLNELIDRCEQYLQKRKERQAQA